MYARATMLEVDTLRTSVADAVSLFRHEVLPGLQAHPGFRGVVVLSTEEGKGVLLSFWASEEDAEAETPFYETEIAKHLTLFRAPPGREAYVVELVEGLALESV